jgi:hypothetical protein
MAGPTVRSQRGGREFEPPAVHHFLNAWGPTPTRRRARGVNRSRVFRTERHRSRHGPTRRRARGVDRSRVFRTERHRSRRSHRGARMSLEQNVMLARWRSRVSGTERRRTPSHRLRAGHARACASCFRVFVRVAPFQFGQNAPLDDNQSCCRTMTTRVSGCARRACTRRS